MRVVASLELHFAKLEIFLSMLMFSFSFSFLFLLYFRCSSTLIKWRKQKRHDWFFPNWPPMSCWFEDGSMYYTNILFIFMYILKRTHRPGLKKTKTKKTQFSCATTKALNVLTLLGLSGLNSPDLSSHRSTPHSNPCINSIRSKFEASLEFFFSSVAFQVRSFDSHGMLLENKN